MPKTKVRIKAVYWKSYYMLNTAQIAAITQYYADADRYSLKSAKNEIRQDVAIIERKNPAVSISTAAIEAPKKIILKEAEKSDNYLIIVGPCVSGTIAVFLPVSVSQSVALHVNCVVEMVCKEMRVRDVKLVKRYSYLNSSYHSHFCHE